MAHNVIPYITILTLLLTACVPIGTNNHEFINNNATTCDDTCVGQYLNNSCGYYKYEWYKNATIEWCICEVTRCYK